MHEGATVRQAMPKWASVAVALARCSREAEADAAPRWAALVRLMGKRESQPREEAWVDEAALREWFADGKSRNRLVYAPPDPVAAVAAVRAASSAAAAAQATAVPQEPAAAMDHA